MIEEDPLTSFEARLASLKPSDPTLHRDHLMFLAGQASVVYWPRYRPSVFRPVVLSMVAAVAVTFLAVTATESGSRIVDRVASAATSTEVSRGRPVPPDQDAVQYRLEVGNSLGWVVSLLVGSRPVETDSSKPKQNLIHLREALLNEGVEAWSSEPTRDRRGPNTATKASVPGQ